MRRAHLGLRARSGHGGGRLTRARQSLGRLAEQPVDRLRRGVRVDERQVALVGDAPVPSPLSGGHPPLMSAPRRVATARVDGRAPRVVTTARVDGVASRTVGALTRARRGERATHSDERSQRVPAGAQASIHGPLGKQQEGWQQAGWQQEGGESQLHTS